MVDLLYQLFKFVQCEECVPRQWGKGLIINVFKKGDRKDPGNYRDITFCVVGKVFCKVHTKKTDWLDTDLMKNKQDFELIGYTYVTWTMLHTYYMK